LEKYYKFLPLGLFCLVVGKSLITGASWEAAAVALVAGLLAGAYEFKNHSKQVESLNKRIETAIDVINAQGKAIEELRISVSSVRLGQQAKAISTQPAKQELQRIF
jgi:hypothetical protein